MRGHTPGMRGDIYIFTELSCIHCQIFRSQTRDESVSCTSELENKPLFIKKFQGRFFQTDYDPSDQSDVAPIPPPRSKSKETSNTQER